MSYPRSPVFICGQICLFITTLSAQTPPDPQTVFRTETNLRQVSVVAQDAKGKAVTDLRRDEFRLLDDGVPREIRFFLETQQSPPAAAVPTAPNTFTNQIAARRGGYSVILLDTLDTSFGDPLKHESGSGYAIQKVREMLHVIPAGYQIAIYTLERARVRVIQEFTTDRDLLEKCAATIRPPADTPDTFNSTFEGYPPVVMAVEGAPPEEAAAGERMKTDFAYIDRMQRSSAIDGEFTQLADHLAGIPGRKNLVWLAQRFPISRTALQKLIQADVAIYPVDVYGLCNCTPAPREQLIAIAAATGGVAYYGRNDLDVAVREALDDGSTSYTLGFYQQADDRTAGRHLVAVNVSRTGVALRYRDAYTTEGRQAAPANPKANLAQALRRPIDATQIPIRATVTRAHNRIDLLAILLPETLALTLNKDRWTGKLQFVARFAAVDEALFMEPFYQTVTLNLSQATYEKAVSGEGIVYHNRLAVPPKAVELKPLVSHLDAGKIGTLTIPLSKVQSTEATRK